MDKMVHLGAIDARLIPIHTCSLLREDRKSFVICAVILMMFLLITRVH